MVPTIAIVGRRNVGKSTLFNCLLEEKKAIVSKIPGTTRDRTEGICFWRGQKIKVIDTGGLDIGRDDLIEKEIRHQVETALKISDLILFLVDLKEGPLPQEEKIANELKKYRQKIILVGNKADSPKWRQKAEDSQWQKLQFGKPVPVSAVSGAGVGDLLDLVLERLKTLNSVSPFGKEEFSRLETEKPLPIAIVGRPNVGKSSLLNALLGEKRVIVTPIPHTTREPQDTEIVFQNRSLILIDTAGLRKKRVSSSKAPHHSEIINQEHLIQKGIERTLKVIEKAEIIFFLLEPVLPLPAADKKIASLIKNSKASVVILINKWDLVDKEKLDLKKYLLSLRAQLSQLDFAPIFFISVLKKTNLQKLLPLALEIEKERKKVIDQKELAKIFSRLVLRQKLNSKEKQTQPIFRRLEQTGINPPQFTLWLSPKQSVHPSFLKFLKNCLRQSLDLKATPLKIEVKQEKNKKYENYCGIG
jgi:GTP-binding protein